MFHCSYAGVVATILFLFPVMAGATNYDVGTTDDVVRIDGHCSLREAMLAINERRGHIGGVFTDLLGVDVQSSGGDIQISKRVINITRSSLLVTAGERLVARRGDILEYRITVRALADGGDSENTTLSFVFPDQNPALDGYRGYSSVYEAGSTKLNGEDVDDPAPGQFPLSSPLPVNSPTGIADDSPQAEQGLVRENESALIVFRIAVAEGENELPLEELPGLVEEEEDREYLVEAECPAGTLSNTIAVESTALTSDDPAARYELSLGEIEVGQASGNAPTVTIFPRKTGPFDTEAKKNVVIEASMGARAFRVFDGATLILDSITVAGHPTDNDIGPGENGGLIFAAGSVELKNRTLLSGGRAESGGAIFLAGNRNLTFADAKFEDNVASLNGGAVATSADYRGIINGSAFHFMGNEAVAGSGGALFIDNQDLLFRPLVSLVNGTFYANTAPDGSAIRINATRRIFQLNNITVAGNDGGAAVSFADPGDDESADLLLNTAVLGNDGGDCAADDGPGGDTFADATIQYVVSLNESCGPQDEEFASDDPLEVIDYSLADFSLLMGVDPADPLSTAKYQCGDNGLLGSAGCLPRQFENGFIGFLPNNRARLAGSPAVYGFGSPDDAVGPSICESRDQRGKERASRCDVGAIELQFAKGTKNEISVIQGVRSVADVIANDLGDLEIDCRRLEDPAVTDPMLGLQISDCLTFDLEPRLGLVDVVIGDGVLTDANGDTIPVGYPMVHYTGPATFHGVDQFRYTLSRYAVDGPSFAGTDPSANVVMVVKPDSGLDDAGDITTLSGAYGGFFGLLFSIAISWRRKGLIAKLVSSLIFLTVASAAQSADIIVNTSVDEEVVNGSCSLREALRASVDNEPFLVPDCASGSTGRDRIIIEVPGTIMLNSQLVVENSSVEIEGLGFAETVIDASAASSRAILALSDMALRGLTIQGGDAAENGGAILTTASLTLNGVVIKDSTAGGSGGAVYLNYSSDLRRAVQILGSEFSGNTAGVNGGVLSMIGQSQRHEILVDSSSFIGNVAVGAGGALDINLPRGGELRVLNSTFALNEALTGGAIDLQNVADDVTAYILNSTFLNTSIGSPGAIELDGALGDVHLSHSIYSGSGNCSSSGAQVLKQSYYNIFSGVAVEPSCEASVASDNEGNGFADQSDIEAVLNDGVLVPGAIGDNFFVPTHFPIALLQAANPAFPLIVDAGNESVEPSGDTGTPRACRSEDLRGASRSSGGVCDLGAFELQVPTAIDDTGSNQRRFDSRSRIDVLDNDLAGDGVPTLAGTVVAQEVLSGAIDLDPDDAGSVNSTFTSGSTTLRRVPNGSWRLQLTDTPLAEGEYLVSVVLKDLGGTNLYSANQTVIVRASGEALDDDEFRSTGNSALRIAGLLNDNGDDPADFITTDGLITVLGTSTAEDGSEIEVFLDGESVGTTSLDAEDIHCGVADEISVADLSDTALEGRVDDCVVLFDPGVLDCDDLNGGYEESFRYRFFTYNPETGVTASADAEAVVTVSNVPPRFAAQEVTARPGDVVVFQINPEDPDSPDGPNEPILITADNLSLKQAPQFAASSLRTYLDDGNTVSRFLTFGIVGVGAIDPAIGDVDPLNDTEGLGLVVDPDALTVTYTPRNFESSFNDRFVLAITDQCGGEMSAEFTISYPGSTSAGVTGVWGMLVMFLLYFRRSTGRKLFAR